MNKIMIAAPKSGSGKTSITVALLESLKRRGLNTVSFKCGPDYIDPLFHRTVLGIPSFNLDTYFTDEELTKKIFDSHISGAEVSVTEGVMGLFDGVGGMEDEGSSYHLASVTGSRIVLALDAKGACRSLLPLISGILSYDENKLICGVILNRCSEAVYEKLSPEIRKLGIIPLGYMRDKKELILPSRHLGLTTPSDIENIDHVIDLLFNEFNENVQLDKILELTEENICNSDNDKSHNGNSDNDKSDNEKSNNDKSNNVKSDNDKSCLNDLDLSSAFEIFGVDMNNISNDCKAVCKIAVAKDDAFCFLYEDNLNLLRYYGAEIVFFSPLKDDHIPEDADGIYFPGGYPELYLERLEANETMHSSIQKAYAEGMPFFAECGGFMYLHRSIEDIKGNKHKTVGIIDSDCIYKGKSTRFGYVEIKEKTPSFLGEEDKIKGHEFHYWDTESINGSCTAFKPSSGKSYDCIIANDHAWMGFPHLYFPSCPSFAENFVSKSVAFKVAKAVNIEIINIK